MKKSFDEDLILELLEMATPDKIDELKAKLRNSPELFDESNYDVGIILETQCYLSDLSTSSIQTDFKAASYHMSQRENHIKNLFNFTDKYRKTKRADILTLLLKFAYNNLFRLKLMSLSSDPEAPDIDEYLDKVKSYKEILKIEKSIKKEKISSLIEFYELSFKGYHALNRDNKRQVSRILIRLSSLKIEAEEFQTLYPRICLKLASFCNDIEMEVLHYNRLKKVIEKVRIPILNTSLLFYAIHLGDTDKLTEILDFIEEHPSTLPFEESLIELLLTITSVSDYDLDRTIKHADNYIKAWKEEFPEIQPPFGPYMLMIKGEIQKAEDKAKELLNSDPENSSYLNTLGDISFKQKNFKSAKKYFTEAQQIEPKLDYLTSLFFVSISQREYVEAEGYLHVMENEFSSNLIPTFLKGILLKEQGELEQALEHFEKVIEWEVDIPLNFSYFGQNGKSISFSTTKSGAFILSAQIELDLKHAKRAEKLTFSTLKIEPMSHIAFELLANIGRENNASLQIIQGHEVSAKNYREINERLSGFLSSSQSSSTISRLEINKLLHDFRNKHGIISSNPLMAKVFSKIESLASMNIDILITGETGTGKELVAEAIHKESGREGKIITINSAAISSNLQESELFGHVKGAFTGAIKDKKGKVELADKGTLFLDEVTSMNINTQVKWLRVLEQHEIEPVGSVKTVKVDFRLISATNEDISLLVKEGKFRKDLFSRIKGDEIHLPTLKERADDIPELSMYFYNNIVGKKMDGASFKPSLKDFEILKYREWDGNIRQLKNFIKKIVAKFQREKEQSRAEFRRLLGWETDISAKTETTYQAFSKNSPLADDDLQHALIVYLTNKLNESKTAKELKISNNTLNKMVNTAFILYSVEYGDDAVDRILENAPDDIHQKEEFVLKLKRIFRNRIDICIKYFLKSNEERSKKRSPYYYYKEDLLKKLSNRSN